MYSQKIHKKIDSQLKSTANRNLNYLSDLLVVNGMDFNFEL